MHTITVSIQGNVNIAESVEVNDGEALPLFIKLKSVLQSEDSPKPLRRRGRPAAARTEDHSAPASADEANALDPREA